MVLESFCQFDVDFTQVSVSTEYEWKRFPQWRGECLKTLKLFKKIINPHPNISIDPSTQLQHPDPNKTSTINTVPFKQKDSAINVCTLNIRSLTIKEDSIKLKRLFKLDSAIIVWSVWSVWMGLIITNSVNIGENKFLDTKFGLQVQNIAVSWF